MNELTARQNGYSFTGAYSRNKQEMKERAAEERAKGNKAIVVNVPTNKLSRGYKGMGYAVYFIESEKNIQIKREQEKKRKIARLQEELLEAKVEVERLTVKLAKVMEQDT